MKMVWLLAKQIFKLRGFVIISVINLPYRNIGVLSIKRDI